MSQQRSHVEQIAHEVIGAAIEVHRELGAGYLEAVYEEALAAEFALRRISYLRQSAVNLNYKGIPGGQSFLDFLVGDCLVVELKAVESILPIHQAQVISYLKATHKTLGLLINFNVVVLKSGIRRIVLNHES